MAKPKSPLLSLGARGTIADTLTYQKRGREHIVRQKPIPRDPYSLNQAYQRWDYRDYAYLWTLLSNVEKQVYRTRASKYHLTGFSLWMRENLKALTNLAGRWHLDEKSGATAYDSSRNANKGIIFGASPIKGLIDGAFYFDGLNDEVICGTDPSLDCLNGLTVISYFKTTTNYQSLVGKCNVATNQAAFVLRNDFFSVFETKDQAYPGIRAIITTPTNDGTWHCLAGRWAPGLKAQLFLDGIFNNQSPAICNHIEAVTEPFRIGRTEVIVGNFFKGIQDNIILYPRYLDDAELLRHSKRRYPP